jgi:hypothetical protein
VLTSDGQFRGIMYRHEVELTPSPGQWDANSLNVPVIRDATWEGAQLRLLGSSAVPAEMMAGTRLPLDLFWAAGQSLPAALGLSFELDGNLIGTFPLSRYDTGRWLPGTVIHEKYRLLLPPELKGGRRMLQMQVVDDSNVPLTGPFVELGVIDIEVTDRLFSRPQGIPIELNYPFAETIKLIGLEIGEIPAGPGEELSFTLVWQAEADQALMYNAFVHVLGPDGRIAAQADQWPGGQPTNSWLAGQVILDQYSIRLPAEAPAGSYQVVTGLYRLADGLRLPVVDSGGSALPERRVVLPIEWSIASPGQ